MPEAEEKIRVDGEIKVRENRYYAKIADRYRIFGFLVILLLVVMCGVLLVKYGEYITYDNFVYLMRDFESVNSSDKEYTTVTYPAQDSVRFEPFRDGFALVGNSKVTVYDRSGVELCSESESLSYPAAVSSEKYLLVYDVGGKSYSIYNSVARVMRVTTDAPIVSASVGDDGSYMVTMESNDARDVTEVYNSAFRRTMRIYKDKYVTDSAISLDSDAFVITSVSESGADMAGEVAFYKKGEAEAVKTYSYNISLPLVTASLEGGNFAVVFDDAVRFYSSAGELLSESVLAGEAVSYFDASRSGIALVCKGNSIGSESLVYSFDSEGGLVYTSSVAVQATGVSVSKSNDDVACYLVDAHSVVAVHKDGETESFAVDGEILDVIDTAVGPLAMMPEHATRFDKENNEETPELEEKADSDEKNASDETSA